MFSLSCYFAFIPPSSDHLKAPLDDYVLGLRIVRVLRQKERKGLITARLMGAKAARGEVLTFLDSHCEYMVMMFLIYRAQTVLTMFGFYYIIFSQKHLI